MLLGIIFRESFWGCEGFLVWEHQKPFMIMTWGREVGALEAGDAEGCSLDGVSEHVGLAVGLLTD